MAEAPSKLESTRKLDLGETYQLGEFVQANILSEMCFENSKHVLVAIAQAHC